MKKTIGLIFILFTLIIVEAASPKKTIAEHPSKLKFDSLSWTVPLGKPYRKVLDNGLRLYIAEDNTYPLVRIVGYIFYGSILDPVGKEGLGKLTSRLLRTGGTKKYRADSLDLLLDLYSITVSFSVNLTEMIFSASFLSEFTDTAIDILQQMMFYPAFEKDKYEHEKQLILQQIKNRFDNPEPVLEAAYRKMMYPRCPNSSLETENSIKAISLQDVVSLYKNIMKTENIILTVSGNIKTKDFENRLLKIFPKCSVTVNTLMSPEIKIEPMHKCMVVHKKGSQANVRIGLPLFKRPHPDYYPLSILNEILGGGGFTSRLVERVRSDSGLSYAIWSMAESNYIFPATLYIQFQTKTEATSKAIALVLNEIEKIRSSGVTETELDAAKRRLIEALPSMFRSSYDIVSTYGWNEYYNRPDSIYAQYPEKIRAITLSDVYSVAQKYLVPSKCNFAIVGDTAAIFSADTFANFSLKKLQPYCIPYDSVPFLP